MNQDSVVYICPIHGFFVAEGNLAPKGG